jgi:DNA-binding NtrC family response regulator
VLSDIDELKGLQADHSDPSSDVGAVGGIERAGESRPATEDVPGPGVGWIAEQHSRLLRGLTCTVTAELDLHRLVNTILDQAVQAVGAERGILFLGDTDAAGLVPVLALNIRGEELRTIEKVSRTILKQGWGGPLVTTPDALVDPRFASVPSVKLNQMRSVLCAPIISLSGPVGVLYLDAGRPAAFPNASVSIIETLAAVAATALENARIHGEVVAENTRLRGGGSPESIWDAWIGEGPAMERVRRQASLAAALRSPVLIKGEPGSGRRHLARMIHDAGRRAREAFVACDCAVAPRELLKGLILGRSGAAARGGRAPEVGLARQADRGTLFLTNAEEIDEGLASGLAGILDEGLLRSLGGRRDERIDLRLIVATGPDAARGASPGELPSALAERVSDLQLLLPPLRERVEDIPALAAQFIHARIAQSKRVHRVSFTPEGMRLLQAQPWPGNLRELRQVVSRIVLRGRSVKIEADQVATALESAGRDSHAGLETSPDRVPTLRELEEAAIRQALARTQGNRAEAAKLLGIHRNTLLLKAKAMGIRT